MDKYFPDDEEGENSIVPTQVDSSGAYSVRLLARAGSTAADVHPAVLDKRCCTARWFQFQLNYFQLPYPRLLPSPPTSTLDSLCPFKTSLASSSPGTVDTIRYTHFAGSLIFGLCVFPDCLTA